MNFNNDKYKVYTWKNWMMLHYIINPGLAVNEILFGMRVPKISLVDKTSEKPLVERSFIPCPHCNTIHDHRTWSSKNNTAFKNWFGLFCPTCEKIIPCLTNATTFIILAITFPLWGWFKNSLKKKWLEKQPKRFKNLDLESIPNPYKNGGWIKIGLMWGLFMFVFMTFVSPLISGEDITSKSLITAIPIWIIAGLGFGYVMKFIMNKKGKKVS